MSTKAWIVLSVALVLVAAIGGYFYVQAQKAKAAAATDPLSNLIKTGVPALFSWL